MPPQSPEDDRRCDGHPDCDPGTDEPRIAEETSDTCEGSARGEERQAAADQQRKRAACQQEQARPSTDKHARAMRVVVLIGLFTVERGALVGGGSCGVGVSA